MRICKYGFSNWPSSSWILLPSGQNPLFHGIVEQHAKQKPSANLKIVSSTFSTILEKHQLFMNLLKEHLGSKKDIHSVMRDGSTVMSCHPILQIQCTKTRQGTSKRFSLRDFQLEVQGSSFKWFFARSKISLGRKHQFLFKATCWPCFLVEKFRWFCSCIHFHTDMYCMSMPTLFFVNCITRLLWSCHTVIGNFSTGLNTLCCGKPSNQPFKSYLHDETSFKSSSGSPFCNVNTLLQ